MIFNDLREFIAEVEKRNDVKVIEGVDWNLEIGLITEWQISEPSNPLLLFKNIKGYPPEYFVATNLFATQARTALALGLPPDMERLDIVRTVRDIFREGFTYISPVEVDNAPVKENILTGNNVDLFKFPTPKWHARDGGRYIGTGDAVITQDPDEGWVNLGTYRVQIHDKSIATIYISPGKHGKNMRNKHWKRGQSCPAAIAIGLEPILYMSSYSAVPEGISEYEYAGGFRKKPIEITRGVTTGLPIPATAEIVLEGEIIETQTISEGPFGEWTAYYGSGPRQEHIFKVNAILHRNNPILQGNPPLRSPYYVLAQDMCRAAATWAELDKQIPGVKGVWLLDSPHNMIAVVSLEQRYPGHAMQAAMGVAFIHSSLFMNRFIILVDEDIDPSNMQDLLWAVATRCEPATDIDILRRMRGNPLDPCLPPEKRTMGDFTHSTAIIDACRPYAWKDQFPQTIMSSPQELESVKQKWEKFFK